MRTVRQLLEGKKAGVITIDISAGRMQKMSTGTILIGALRAISSARWRRLTRDSAASVRIASTIWIASAPASRPRTTRMTQMSASQRAKEADPDQAKGSEGAGPGPG